MRCLRAVVAWVALAVLGAGGACAEPIVVGGYEFSDELGGFTLLAASGRGTREDPFVLVEEIHGNGPAVMVVRLVGWLQLGEPMGSELGIRVRKVVVNRSGFPWGVFRMELREHRDVSSDYYDGLSFDQAQLMPRPFLSDVYLHADEDLEPDDSVTFSAGLVEDGGTVTMEVSITDPTPISTFYLRQSMNRPVALLMPRGEDPAMGR